jgi:hypothetical protein
MSTLSYTSGNPANLVGGATANMADISGPFTDITTWANGNVDTTNLATSAKPVTVLGAYRTISSAFSAYIPGATAGVYSFGIAAGGLVLSGTTSSVLIQSLSFAAADYAVSGLTAKGRLRCSILANATAPAITFTFGLYPVTCAGSAGLSQLTLGTVVTGSTAVITTPPASTPTQAVGSDFTLPADGVYVLGAALSGTVAANAFGQVSARFDIHHV